MAQKKKGIEFGPPLTNFLDPCMKGKMKYQPADECFRSGSSLSSKSDPVP